jgi:hypothetical protein
MFCRSTLSNYIHPTIPIKPNIFLTFLHSTICNQLIWRKHLGLTPVPSPADKSFLLPRSKGKGAIQDTTYIRKIVQNCFNKAIESLEKDSLREEAESLAEATVHWLRHTGISEDVKHRPKEHVRDDAGHSSSAITDKYIDIELKARHQSAKNKIIPE